MCEKGDGGALLSVVVGGVALSGAGCGCGLRTGRLGVIRRLMGIVGGLLSRAGMGSWLGVALASEGGA